MQKWILEAVEKRQNRLKIFTQMFYVVFLCFLIIIATFQLESNLLKSYKAFFTFIYVSLKAKNFG